MRDPLNIEAEQGRLLYEKVKRMLAMPGTPSKCALELAAQQYEIETKTTPPKTDALAAVVAECQALIGSDDVCGLPRGSQIHSNYSNPMRHDFVENFNRD